MSGMHNYYLRLSSHLCPKAKSTSRRSRVRPSAHAGAACAPASVQIRASSQTHTQRSLPRRTAQHNEQSQLSSVDCQAHPRACRSAASGSSLTLVVASAHCRRILSPPRSLPRALSDLGWLHLAAPRINKVARLEGIRYRLHSPGPDLPVRSQDHLDCAPTPLCRLVHSHRDATLDNAASRAHRVPSRPPWMTSGRSPTWARLLA